MTALRERRLLRRLQRHDENAFQEFVRLYQHQVFNLVLRMLGNRAEAEDVAQDVFVTVFKSIESFRGESKISTWLYRIAMNQCQNRIKYLSRRPTVRSDVLVESSTAPQAAGPEAQLRGRQLEGLVQEAIAELDEEHRMLIVLRDIEELAYQEICSITGLPEGTVKSRLHRARLALREHVKKRGG